ncbi:hypothetical protein [Tamlana crocina]|uniref:NlpE C-terminal OB domain-containing protein n=1 Tax=Tamlana crocina TaxID=393006 RepID=A0ABX1DA89_9FLAO|nr:hypothetical protein [Tamlana crocina]NJX15293.1 hypothetical protein [Tamlana crocina]
MKNIFSIALILSVFLSCKNDNKSEQKEETNTISTERTEKQSDGLTLLKGEFVYYDGAAVLQTHADIYGVFITDKLKELSQRAEQYKNEPTDMVEVEIRGKITNQKDDKILWENKVEIAEILNVNPLPKDKNNVVKLGQE